MFNQEGMTERNNNIIRMWESGTKTKDIAIKYQLSVKRIRDIINKHKYINMLKEEAEALLEMYRDNYKLMPIQVIRPFIPVRYYNVLRNENIKTIHELQMCSAQRLLDSINFGVKGIEPITNAMNMLNLKWPR